jgi:hypothetical protein
MKKIILLSLLAASIPAYALPTYEPFTEYATAIAATGTNAIDLCTSGAVLPSGDAWGCLYFSGTFGTNIKGVDILVTNNPGLFSATAIGTLPLLPTTFPGYPAAGQSITNMLENPAQPFVNGAASANIIGNSAVLTFTQDFTRPATGTVTVYMSYLWSLAMAGQLGGGNDARYLNFVAATNTVEGKGTSGFYQTWTSMLDTLPGTCTYGANSVIAGGSGYYNVACDNSTGKEFTTTPFTAAFGQVQFIVTAYTFQAVGSSSKDTMTMWVNPSVSAFGGATPPSSPIFVDTMPKNMSDIGGLVIDDRPGHGANAGGLGTNYMANLMLGTTWSYVTGGPEFTNTTGLPANTILSPGANLSLSAAATAASQTVTYQWQHNGANVNNGANGAGGGATVAGATSTNLTLTGVSSADAGSYSLLATASGTGYSLSSPIANVIISDPGIISAPQPATANAGGTVTFSAQAETSTSQLSYAWYDGSTMLANGLQPTGSTAFGAQGTNNATGTVTLTLTLSNVVCGDDGNYSLIVSNALGSNAATSAASLTVNDPYIVAQPPASAEVAQGTSTTISVGVAGTGLTYQWFSTTSGQLSNSGDDSGVTTPTLTISSAQASDAGTYYVQVSGSCGGPITSSNTVVYFDTPASSVTISPAALTQQTNTHLALAGMVTDGSGLIHMLVQKNGTTLANGIQPDGSFVSGQVLTNPGVGAVVLSNLLVADSGTYTLLASNVAGVVSSSPGFSVVTIVPAGSSLLSLSTNQLVVTRVGEGSEPLSGATGNTLYLDQFATNGAYVSTIMVPDSGPNAIVVAGAAVNPGLNEGPEEAYLTLSSNQQYLNFGGFCYSYPYTGGADVTVGQQEAGGSLTNNRAIYALNAAGTMALVYTNYGLYSGGHGFRDVYSTDGLTNFWTTGSAGAGTVKYVNAGPAGAGYTITSPGNGIPALSSANTGGSCLGLAGTNLVFSENLTDGVDASTLLGLDEFTGAPTVSTTATTELLPGGVSHADDFAFSPDLNTIYVADDDVSINSGGYGGVQRWDLEGGTYQYSYNLSDNTGSGTNGMRGMTVIFPTNITTWGQGVNGAILYATTSEVQGNRIIQIVDNGQSSPSTLLATAGPNQFYRGIRFGPKTVPLAATASQSIQSPVVGQLVAFTGSVSGLFSYYFPNASGTAYNLITIPATSFQWYSNGGAIPGATNLSYNIASVQLSNAGTYTLVVSNAITAPVTNTPGLVLTVSPFNVNSDLVGWFKFADGSGTNAVDSSSYGDTGMLTNFPTDNSEWVAGLGGQDALNFANADGLGDNAVLVPDAPQLNFTNNLAFTLAAWIKSGNTNQISGAGLIEKGFGNGGEQYTLDVYTNAYRFYVRNAAAGAVLIYGSNVPPSNQWQHVAATFDGNAGVMALYVNGQMVRSNSTAPSSLLYTTSPLSIGNRMSSSNSAYNLPFLGEMQDVRLYSIALGAQDIQAIYSPLSVAASPSHITSSVSGGTLQLNLAGVPNSSFRLWSTTNLALRPVDTAWTLVTNSTFNSSGTATYNASTTGAVNFYTITQP